MTEAEVVQAILAGKEVPSCKVCGKRFISGELDPDRHATKLTWRFTCSDYCHRTYMAILEE